MNQLSEGNPQGNENVKMVTHGGSCLSSSNNPAAASAIEGSLSKGFAGLLSTGSCFPFDQKNQSLLQLGTPSCDKRS